MIAQCPNCRARYNATQKLLDSYGGFFRCGKCDTMFNYYDQFSSSSEKPPVFTHLKKDYKSIKRESSLARERLIERTETPIIEKTKTAPQLIVSPTEVENNIVFNQYDDTDDENSEPKLNQNERDLTVDPFLEVQDISQEEVHEPFPSIDSYDVADVEADDVDYDPTVSGESAFNFMGSALDDLSVILPEEYAPSLELEALGAPSASHNQPASGMKNENLGVSTDRKRSESLSKQFNSAVSDYENEVDDEGIDQALIVELEQEYLQERKSIFGEVELEDNDYGEKRAPSLPEIGSDLIGSEFEHTLDILDDVEEDTKVIDSFGVLWIGLKYIVRFFFWSLIVLALIAVLVYQFKPRLNAELQEEIDTSPVVRYLCKFVVCAAEEEQVISLEVVVSRMDLYSTPSEPLNISLFILNRLGEPQRYPIIRLALKNLQGLTVGQRYYKPTDYLNNPSASIPPGNIVKVSLKLDDPPAKAVGFEVNLL
ncbi:MAG: putative Zn finger-like uncharacterized protein [Saprospiraceae bacterium]|jgi:predicted Zn finger-like uncharacterized protein